MNQPNLLDTLNYLFADGETIALGLLSTGMTHRFSISKQKIADFAAAEDKDAAFDGIYLNLQHHSGRRDRICQEDVDRYKFVLIDIDRKVKTGLTVQEDSKRKLANEGRAKESKLPRLPYLPATSEELDRLAAVRDHVAEYCFAELGVGPTIVACTGNGWHLLYTVENTAPADKKILAQCLTMLSVKFDSDEGCGVSVDRSTADEPQLVRFYGTWNRKGLASAERPHRQSYIVAHNQQPPLSKTQLLAFALNGADAEVLIATTARDYPELDEDFDCDHLIEWVHERLPEHMSELFEIDDEYEAGGKRHISLFGCINAGHKHRGDVNKTQLIVGDTLGFKCFSDECEDVSIGDLLKKVWDLCGEKYPYPIWKKRAEGYGLNISREDDVSSAQPHAFELTGDVPKPVPWTKYAKALDVIREGKESWTDDQGKVRTRTKPRHAVEEEVLQFVLSEVLQPNAKLFFDAYAYLFVPNDNRIYNWSNDIDAYDFLANLHLRLTQPGAKLVRENLNLHILTKGESVRIEKYGGMHGDAIYVNNGRGGMFKITADAIREVRNGVDGVLVSSSATTQWPKLEDAGEKLASMRERLHNRGGMIAETPLCKHFSGMFDESQLTSAQYQQLILLRYLSLFMGDTISLYPMMMSLGEQGSGKSTLWEKIMWVLNGPRYESGALPTKMRDFIASVTNSAIQIYDNIDGVNFSRGEYQSYLDILCKCCTGGTVDIAQLYSTNVARSYSLRCHIFLTARVSPFPTHRSDVARRTLFFPVRKPEKDEYVTVEQMKAQIEADADDMKLETLLRLQLALRGLLANREKEYPPVSEMHSFENFTMRLADYEGWASEMVAIWEGCKLQYQQRVTEDSPLVDVVRRWIGSNPTKNCGRPVRAGEIYKELLAKYDRAISENWKNNAVFGKRIKESFSALRILGIKESKLDGYVLYTFAPSPVQVQQCVLSYEDSVPNWHLANDREEFPIASLDLYE